MDKFAVLHQCLNVCIWRHKMAVFQQLLLFDFHATLASELSKTTTLNKFLTVDPDVPPGLAKFAFCHMFGRPTCAISAEGCPCPRKFTSHHMFVRHARSPQTVAAGKEDSHFTTPHVCPSDTRDLRRGLPKDKQDPHFATRLGVRHAADWNIS